VVDVVVVVDVVDGAQVAGPRMQDDHGRRAFPFG
jgi:hypothetical protein